MSKKTLLLTQWFFPIKILRWEDAITMLCLDKARVVVNYDEQVSSPSTSMKLPAVITLKRPVAAMKRAVKFSRINVYTRDHFKCQYCAERFPMSKLTYDHVVPRSAGGRTEWENIVTACRGCNGVKDNRTCDEAGMWPLAKPVRPKTLPLTAPMLPENVPDEWLAFVKDVPA